MDRSTDGIKQLYRRRARFYDVSSELYALLGFRLRAYRAKAVEALHVRSGDVVVEVGCGTGQNFALIQRHIGPEGRIIGVDLSDAMIDRARERIRRHGWRNVELVESDAASYRFPKGIGGIISTFAITLVPEYDSVIRAGAEALAPGGRFVVLDFKKPANAPMCLVQLGVWLTQAYGVSLDLADRHPWKSIHRYLANSSLTELYGGFAYISVGEAPAASAFKDFHVRADLEGR